MPTPNLKRGVRTIIFLICKLVAIYRKYKSNAGQELPPAVVAALDALDAACELLDEYNVPGSR